MGAATGEFMGAAPGEFMGVSGGAFSGEFRGGGAGGCWGTWYPGPALAGGNVGWEAICVAALVPEVQHAFASGAPAADLRWQTPPLLVLKVQTLQRALMEQAWAQLLALPPLTVEISLPG